MNKPKKKRNKKGFNSIQKKQNLHGVWFWVHRKYGTWTEIKEVVGIE